MCLPFRSFTSLQHTIMNKRITKLLEAIAAYTFTENEMVHHMLKHNQYQKKLTDGIVTPETKQIIEECKKLIGSASVAKGYYRSQIVDQLEEIDILDMEHEALYVQVIIDNFIRSYKTYLENVIMKTTADLSTEQIITNITEIKAILERSKAEYEDYTQLSKLLSGIIKKTMSGIIKKTMEQQILSTTKGA